MKKIITIGLCLLFTAYCQGQTFFQAADGEGVINISSLQQTLQVRATSSSSSITVGYYGKRGLAIDNHNFIYNGELKFKPDDDGVATILKKGHVAPGIQLAVAGGYRWRRPNPGRYWAHELTGRFAYQYAKNTLFDSARLAFGRDALYDTFTNVWSGAVRWNYMVAPGTVNWILGVELGFTSSTNISDLDDVSLQTVSATDTANRFLISDEKAAKIGKVKHQVTVPVKIDLILDPQIRLGAAGSNVTLAFLAYYRTDVGKPDIVSRLGLGICLLDGRDPTRIAFSMGYELPELGSKPAAIKKGTVFLSVGYSILRNRQ